MCNFVILHTLPEQRSIQLKKYDLYESGDSCEGVCIYIFHTWKCNYDKLWSNPFLRVHDRLPANWEVVNHNVTLQADGPLPH